MYYVKISSCEEYYSYWSITDDDYRSKPVMTTRLVGPFNYRKDVENYMESNDVVEVIQIDRW